MKNLIPSCVLILFFGASELKAQWIESTSGSTTQITSTPGPDPGTLDATAFPQTHITLTPATTATDTLAAGTVINVDGISVIRIDGTIDAIPTGSVGITFGGTTLSLLNNGIIGGDAGVVINSGTATIVNNGTLVGDNLCTIEFSGTATGTVINFGTMRNDNCSVIDFLNGGVVYNHGTIIANGVDGILFLAGKGTVYNYGSIQGTAFFSSITLSEGGDIHNYGTLSGQGVLGVVFLSSSPTGDVAGNLTNFGTIRTTDVFGPAVFTSSFNTGNTIRNYGLIDSSLGAQAIAGCDGSERIFNINGTIIGGSAFDAIDLGSGADNSLYNLNGVITANGGGKAVTFGAATDSSATLGSFSRITGTIDGEGGTGNRLRFEFHGVNAAEAARMREYLAANPSSGTLTYLGQDYVYANFATVEGAFFAYGDLGSTPNARALGANLDSFTSLPDSEMRLLLSALIQSGNIPGGLDQLLPHSLEIIPDILFDNATFDSSRIENRLNGVRSGNPGGLDLSGLNLLDGSVDASLALPRQQLLAFNPVSKTVQDAGPTLSPSRLGDSKRWGAYALGSIIMADLDTLPTGGSSRYDTFSTQVGTDCRFNPHLIGGVFMGYSSTWAMGSNQKLRIESYQPGLYGCWHDGPWYVNGMLGGGISRVDTTRDIFFANRSATGDTDGYQLTASTSAGFDFKSGDWTYGPVAGLQATHYHLDAYTETGAGAANLTVGEQNAESLRSKLGGRLQRSWKIKSFTVRPELHAFWLHEFLDDARNVSAQFAGSGLGSFNVTTATPDRDSALLGLGLQGGWDNSVALFINYDAQVQPDSLGQNVSGGVKVMW